VPPFSFARMSFLHRSYWSLLWLPQHFRLWPGDERSRNTNDRKWNFLKWQCLLLTHLSFDDGETIDVTHCQSSSIVGGGHGSIVMLFPTDCNCLLSLSLCARIQKSPSSRGERRGASAACPGEINAPPLRLSEEQPPPPELSSPALPDGAHFPPISVSQLLLTISFQMIWQFVMAISSLKVWTGCKRRLPIAMC